MKSADNTFDKHRIAQGKGPMNLSHFSRKLSLSQNCRLITPLDRRSAGKASILISSEPKGRTVDQPLLN